MLSVTSTLSLLLLMAIGQGLFLAAALLLSRQPAVRGANRLLSALLLVCVAIIGHAWLGINGLYQTYPHSALAVATLGLLAGPLLYLYLGSMLFDRALGWRQFLHFIPFTIATLALLPFYLQPADAKLAWMVGRTGPPWYLGLAAVAKLALFLIYIRASQRLMQKVGAGPLLRGLRRLLIVWLVGGVLSITALAMEFADVPMAISADAVGALALLCFVYATAFLAIRLPLGYRPQPEQEPAPRPRYANSRLPEEARAGFLAKLSHSMEQRELYRNGELTLDELAAELAMTGHELSQLDQRRVRRQLPGLPEPLPGRGDEGFPAGAGKRKHHDPRPGDGSRIQQQKRAQPCVQEAHRHDAKRVPACRIIICDASWGLKAETGCTSSPFTPIGTL